VEPLSRQSLLQREPDSVLIVELHSLKEYSSATVAEKNYEIFIRQITFFLMLNSSIASIISFRLLLELSVSTGILKKTDYPPHCLILCATRPISASTEPLRLISSALIST